MSRLALWPVLSAGVLAMSASAFAGEPAKAEAEAEAEAPSAGATMIEAHLASYRNRPTAERGWGILADDYSSVLYFKQAIREVDLPGKGHFFRLYADGDPDMLASLCKSMEQRKLYCVLHTNPR